MEIEHCIFPDQLLYDVDNFVWAIDDDSNGSMLVGMTAVLTFIAGKISNIRIKNPATSILEWSEVQ
jgi:glycine cleavage system H protein